MKIDTIHEPGFGAIVEGLVKDLSPMAIVCFGYSTSTVKQQSCFEEFSSVQHHYDLLIINKQEARLKDHEIIDLVNNRFKNQASINVLSHSEVSVLHALKENHPFFFNVLRNGVMLYQAEESLLKLIDLNKAKEEHSPIPVREYTRAFELSEHLLQVASDAIGGGVYDVGVFLLHQCMEQTCIASVKAHLQYRPTTHSLRKLIDLVNCYIPQARTYFPCSTMDEQELFDFLKKAYSDVRYKTVYRVPSHIAFALLVRVEKFQKLLLEKYRQVFQTEAIPELA